MNRLYTSPKDNFSWWIVTDIAEEIFCVEKIQLYALHDDESDSLLESMEEIEEAKKMGMRIGMRIKIRMRMINGFMSTFKIKI